MTFDLILGLFAATCGIVGLGLILLMLWGACASAKEADELAARARARRAERELRTGWDE